MSKNDVLYVLQWVGYLAVVLLLIHWFAGGVDDIIETPAQPLEGVHEIN